MFLWRNILSAVCWVCCCVPLFAQEIDYSKCSCDSIARFYSQIIKAGKKSQSSEDSTFVSQYNGFTRTVFISSIKDYRTELKYCSYVNSTDSIIVKYTSNEVHSNRLQIAKIDYRTLPVIVPFDSSVYHKDLYGKIIRSNHYKWGYNPFVNHNYFRFDLELKIIRSIQGKDSVFTGYYEPVYLLIEGVTSKNDSIRFSKNFEPVLRVYYTQDDSGYYHGKFTSYRENGKINESANYKHGVIDGYYYYNDGGQWCSCSGRFVDGVQRGRWRFKHHPIFRKPYKETIWFSKNGKVYIGRIIPIKKISDDYIEILCGEHPAGKIIDGLFNIFNRK